jgi:hypothetical protein
LFTGFLNFPYNRGEMILSLGPCFSSSLPEK